MTTALQTLTSKLASRLEMGDGSGLIETLKATAFKGQVSDAQMTALMVVANQYGLNPWTKEIYAFPDKNNGIVPVVGVDGWSRIINSNPEFDGMEFEQDDESCTCKIYRKDRSRPTSVTEYMSECKRANVGPWQSHPKRMLRHKAMIQCARLAFGFTGIYDQDEAERIVESGPAEKVVTGEVIRDPYSAEDFAKNLPKWTELIQSGKKSAAQIVAMVNSKAPLTDEQTDTLLAIKVTPDGVMTDAEIAAARARELAEANQ
jgi:phage recombination protein Bet